MIILLFVIMFSQEPGAPLSRQTNALVVPALVLCGAVAVSLARLLARTCGHAAAEVSAPVPTTATIGRLLLGELLIPFEAVSLVLLAALVGAVLFAQRKETP